MTHWHDRQPIFRQLADQITQQILQGVWKEGEALPSVRSISADLKINHLTVMKGYQLLVDEGLVEKKTWPRHVCRTRGNSTIALCGKGSLS